MVFKGAHFIGGRWSKGKGAAFRSLNPADGSVIWEGAAAAQTDVDMGMMAARNAFPTWAELPVEHRIELVRHYQSLLTQRRAELAQLISEETGKPLWEAQGEVGTMLAKVDISITAYHERTGVRSVSTQPDTILTHRPHGVLGILGPFNFPAHLANGHYIPALIAGNSVVLKPSEHTPMVGLFLAALWQEVGLPNGVFTVLNGGGGVGQMVACHSELDVLCFTGSAAVGRQLAHSFGRTPEKLLAMEMGGNNPLILHSAEDADAAALAIVQSAFATSGQRCTCARRLIVVRSPHTQLIVDRLVDWVGRIRVGRFTESPEPFMGPVISESVAHRLADVLGEWERMGGRVLGNRRASVGAFVYPVMIDVSMISRRGDDEYFGPLLQLIEVESIEDAVREANNTKYGLSSSVFTIDRRVFDFCSRRIRAGIVNWNSPTTGSSSKAPFGGMGWSGNHRPTALYAADYCAYPVVSTLNESLVMPSALPLGMMG